MFKALIEACEQTQTDKILQLEAMKGFWNIFKVFQKSIEEDKTSKKVSLIGRHNNVCVLSSIPLECWTNTETRLYESLRRGDKDRSETSLSVSDVFLLIRVVDKVDLLQRWSKSKGTSRCMIIKLVNLHVKAQYLYTVKGIGGRGE